MANSRLNTWHERVNARLRWAHVVRPKGQIWILSHIHRRIQRQQTSAMRMSAKHNILDCELMNCQFDRCACRPLATAVRRHGVSRRAQDETARADFPRQPPVPLAGSLKPK